MNTNVLKLEPKVLKFSDFEPLSDEALKETNGGFIPPALLISIVAPVAVAALGFYNGYKSTR